MQCTWTERKRQNVKTTELISDAKSCESQFRDSGIVA